eukprot:Gb_22568 [translate_table: standard]
MCTDLHRFESARLNGWRPGIKRTNLHLMSALAAPVRPWAMRLPSPYATKSIVRPCMCHSFVNDLKRCAKDWLSVEIGETVEESTTSTDTFTVKNLPPGGTVVVRLKATQAKCSVPFNYTREDTFINGEVAKTRLSDGVFVGVNYSSVEWHTSDVKMATT